MRKCRKWEWLERHPNWKTKEKFLSTARWMKGRSTVNVNFLIWFSWYLSGEVLLWEAWLVIQGSSDFISNILNTHMITRTLQQTHRYCSIHPFHVNIYKNKIRYLDMNRIMIIKFLIAAAKEMVWWFDFLFKSINYHCQASLLICHVTSLLLDLVLVRLHAHTHWVLAKYQASISWVESV